MSTTPCGAIGLRFWRKTDVFRMALRGSNIAIGSLYVGACISARFKKDAHMEHPMSPQVTGLRAASHSGDVGAVAQASYAGYQITTHPRTITRRNMAWVQLASFIETPREIVGCKERYTDTPKRHAPNASCNPSAT